MWRMNTVLAINFIVMTRLELLCSVDECEYLRNHADYL
jgi:hypothetical protein